MPALKAFSLTAIAADMRRELDGHTIARAERVFDKTYLLLRRDDRRLELSVGRPNIFPDPSDSEIIAGAFGAPVDEPTRVKLWLPSQDGTPNLISALRYSWIEG